VGLDEPSQYLSGTLVYGYSYKKYHVLNESEKEDTDETIN
jgi:hypothetical protein